MSKRGKEHNHTIDLEKLVEIDRLAADASEQLKKLKSAAYVLGLEKMTRDLDASIDKLIAARDIIFGQLPEWKKTSGAA